MRINKYLTDQGFCSRREGDRLIEAKRVRINDRVAVLGDQVTDHDKVYVDNELVQGTNAKYYIMYNKPLGITCTTDRRIDGNIVDAVKHPQRVFPIGRLDKFSTGLIFLTNDGDIVNRILRAQFGHEKEYIVEINRPVDEIFLKKMANGVDIGDHITLPCKVNKVKGNTFSIILTEGKNRQIRRMCEALGAVVKKLHRVRIMNVRIGQLKSGEWMDIPDKPLADLKKILEKTKATGAEPIIEVIEE